MASTIRFGRMAGIEIGAHWTWPMVVALVVWSLAVSVFPGENPDLSPAAYLLMALVAALLFFASLLAHELGHAVQARRDGVVVDGITLWVFGGVARLAGEPPTAGAELRIALAGPAVSLLIGVVLLAAAMVVPLPAAVDGVVYWVGSINLALLAFNLLPAFPLDGGRVVRALMRWRNGNLARATEWAAAGGRTFAAAFITAGFVLAVFTASLSGLWLALIGFFLLSAAESELQLVRSRSVLGGLRVADVMVRDPVAVPADLSIQRFFDEVFIPHRHTAYPVVDGEPIGVVSFRDVLSTPREQWTTVRVRDRMRPLGRARVVDAQSDLATVIPQLLEDDLHRALVRDDGRLIGLLSVTDTARVLEALETADELPVLRGQRPLTATARRASPDAGLVAGGPRPGA
ncbi:MAG: site-2 protease family protein [Solirubrobacteraceae bacterium]